MSVATPRSSGAWRLHNDSAWPHGHIVDQTFAFALTQYITRKRPVGHPLTLLDVGAGVGGYGAFFAGCKGAAAITWTGIDGSDGVESLSEGAPSRVSQVNLCGSSEAIGIHDWVISFEVGEHLPRDCLAAFLHTLDRSNRYGAVLSWGHYGQPGIGHITPRAARDVAAAMRFLGYWEDHNASATLQGASSKTWIAHNVQVYRRSGRSKHDTRGPPDLRFPHSVELQRDAEYRATRSSAAIVAGRKCHPKQLYHRCVLMNATVFTMCACMQDELASCET